MRRTQRLKSEEQQHELSPSTSTPKLTPPPNDVVASPSVSEDFIVIGALELASPSKYDLALGHLKLLLDVLNGLQKTVQRNRDSLRPPWPSLEVGFQRFRTKETAAWKASGLSPDSRSRLIRPSGSLESKVAHYLHQPSFKTKSGPGGDTADLSNPCTAIVMGHGFRRGEILVFDHILRQDERSEGLKDYPPQVLQAHEDFAYDILASTHSVVVVVYGSHVQERILRSQKIKTTVVPLWGEYSDVLLVLIHDNSFENEEEHYHFRSIVVFASHPQCLFHQPRDGPVVKRQDKTLKVGFQIADHTIQFDEDYYGSQKWRRAISESMKAHYLQAAGLALADKAPELLSLQEPIVDLQPQANDPGGNSRRDFGKWDSFDPRPHSNDTLRRLLPRAIEATKAANSKEWFSFSDCDLDIANKGR